MGEHWVAMDGNSGKWWDYGNHFDYGNARFYALLEFNSAPTCFEDLSSNVVDTFTNKKCSTQIWDSSAGNLEAGAIFDCRTDSYGNTYCPSSLAQCAQQWDYDSGYSVAKTGSVIDYASKVAGTYTVSMNFTNTISTNESKMCTQIGSYCSGENGTCYFSGTKMIAYGAGGNYVYRVMSNGASCNSSTFGDPAPGSVKNCYIVNQAEMTGGSCPSGYSYLDWIGCSGENGTCYVDGVKTVRYGTGGYYSYANANNAIYCSNTVFGDPIYGAVKTCSFKNTTVKQVSTLNANCPVGTTEKNIWITCSGEGGTCSVPGTQVVRYGGNGSYYYKQNVSGSVSCNNNTFGDPAPNVKKGCSYSQGLCEGTTSYCPSGYADNGTNCQKTVEYSYYNYLCSSSINTQGFNYTPANTGGSCNKTDSNNSTSNPELSNPCNSSTPPANNCKREKFTCQANSDRPCSFVDNKWQCSPFPCMGGNDVTPEGTIEGTSDKNNNGWSEDGMCNGQIYIFNGKDRRCRSWDMFFGLVGGGCCDKDKVFMGLVGCKENEKMLAKQNKAELCTELGEYCSKKIKLGFAKICVQKSKGHCCFGSKLARFVHEQGRSQLGISWGTAENPQCRGFTPEEFQKLDFSKIDLTGAFDIPEINQTDLTNKINSTVTNFKNMLGN